MDCNSRKTLVRNTSTDNHGLTGVTRERQKVGVRIPSGALIRAAVRGPAAGAAQAAVVAVAKKIGGSPGMLMTLASGGGGRSPASGGGGGGASGGLGG